MKIVLTLLSVLIVAQYAAAQTAQCSTLKQFSTTFVPACSVNDVYIKWPNYENQSTYYYCNGVGNPVQEDCPAGQYFTYVLQQCGSCSSYIPPPQCSQLKTQNTPNCYTIGTGSTPDSGLPTPYYPSTDAPTTAAPTTAAPTTAKTTAEPTTAAPTTASPSTAPTPSVPTPPIDGGSTLIPPPPSPVTNDPNVPMPPTPAPTPPSVNVDPPYLPAPGK